MIKQYICKKKNKGNPIGILIADQDDGSVHIGYSLCCKTDTFDEQYGIGLAQDKMYAGVYKVPHSIERQFRRFASHAIRYYNYIAKN